MLLEIFLVKKIINFKYKTRYFSLQVKNLARKRKKQQIYSTKYIYGTVVARLLSASASCACKKKIVFHIEC